jgi:hypothetical protein
MLSLSLFALVRFSPSDLPFLVPQALILLFGQLRRKAASLSPGLHDQ